MKFLPLLTLAVTAVWGQVGKEFQDAELVDLVLPEPPNNELKVEYLEEKVEAELGNTLPVSKTSSQPRVTFSGAKPGKMYTLGERGDP